MLQRKGQFARRFPISALRMQVDPDRLTSLALSANPLVKPQLVPYLARAISILTESEKSKCVKEFSRLARAIVFI